MILHIFFNNFPSYLKDKMGHFNGIIKIRIIHVMSFKTIKYTLARDKLATSPSSISGRRPLDANLTMLKFTLKLTLKSIHRYVERIDL